MQLLLAFAETNCHELLPYELQPGRQGGIDMSEPVTLKLSAQGDDVKLSWYLPTPNPDDWWAPTYSVNREHLRTASQEVRRVLKLIASEACRGTGKKVDYEPYYKELVTASESLRFALFCAVDNAPLDDCMTLLESLPPRTGLRIVTDGTVQIPWNFVYWGDAASALPARNAMGDFDDFWASRFSISVRYQNAVRPPRRAASSRTVKTLFALHRTRFRSAAELLNDNPEISQKIKVLLNHDVGSADNWPECGKKWKSIGDADSILYIFAHSDGHKLLLNEEGNFEERERSDYEINAVRFACTFNKPPASNSNTLCFINGCRTAEGDLGDGFLAVTHKPGFHGFIGSEAEISNEWATRYAVEFLHRLVNEGKSVAQSYDELREVCFPMSLWYSCCAHPGFRIAQE